MFTNKINYYWVCIDVILISTYRRCNQINKISQLLANIEHNLLAAAAFSYVIHLGRLKMSLNDNIILITS